MPQVCKNLDGGRARDREVIDVATRIFWEKGYSGTSVQDVADALGMHKGSLYYYIDSKETLLERIFVDSHAETRGIVDDVLALEAPALDRLHAFVAGLAGWYLANIRRASLYAREWRHAGPSLRALMLEQRTYYDEVLHRLLADAVAAGEPGLGRGGERLAANYVMSAISALPDWFRPSGTRSATAVARAYADRTLSLLDATREPA